jgi:Timeless protein
LAETVKELIRHLRRDGAQHEARQMLGEAKVLQKDLIPLMKDYHGDKELFSIVLRYNDTSRIGVSIFQYIIKTASAPHPLCFLCARRAPLFCLPWVMEMERVNRSSHHQILKRLSPSKRRAEEEQRP